MVRTTRSDKFVAIGQRLRKARQQRGLTQEELAAPEFTRGYISALERGAVRPSVKALDYFASRLEIPLTALLGTKQEREKEPVSAALDFTAFEEDLNYQFNYSRMLIRTDQTEEAFQLLIEAERDMQGHMAKLPPRIRYRLPFLRGIAYLQMSQPDLARPELETALDLAKGDEKATVTVHNVLGAALYLQEQPQLALEHHLLCLRAIHTGVVKDLSLRSTIYRNLANDYWALNDMPQAIGIYKEALALLDDLNDLDRQAGIFWGMAMAYKAVDDWSQAKLYATRALHIYETADNRSDAAAVGMNLAEIFIREERYADAEMLLGRVRGFLSGTGDNVLLSTLYQDYADLARKQGRLEDAAGHIAESIRLASAKVHQSDTAVNAQPQQRIPEEQTAQTAQPRLRAPRANSMRALAEAHHIAALIEEERGHMAAADSLFLQALEWIGQTGFEETVHAITFSYAEVLQARGNFEQAMEYYRAAARSQQRTARLGN